MIYEETHETYKARKAISAGFLWDLVSECPATAFTRSVFNPEPLPAKTSLDFDIGTATHLLTLENSEFAERASLIPYDSYRSNDAKMLRDQAYTDNRTPLRPQDYRLVAALHKALRDPANNVVDLLCGEGANEVSYTWEWIGGPRPEHHHECKARADHIAWNYATIVDLKTAISASPEAFSRAMANNGHHARAAWYLDGWLDSLNRAGVRHGDNRYDRMRDYAFVVVEKSPPHLVSVFTTGEPRANNWFQIDAGAIHKGREAYRRGLEIFRACYESGIWPGYTHRRDQFIGLPNWYVYQEAEKEAEEYGQ